MSTREVQTVSIDPTGPMPPPDGSGRLILNETNGNFVFSAVAAFIFSAVALVSLLYWVIYFEAGHFTRLANPVFTAIIKFGFLLLPFLPFLFGELLSPPRITVNDAGITLRQRGVSKTIPWGDVVEINLQERVIRDRYGGVTSRTYCRVIGARGARLILDPIFGVSPAALAAYLQTRGQAQTSGSIPVTQTPSPVMPQHVRVQLTMLGILAAFAVAIVLAAYGIMRHSPA